MLSAWYIKDCLQVTIKHIEGETASVLLKSKDEEKYSSFKPCHHSTGSFISIVYKVILNDSEDSCGKGLSTISPFTKEAVVCLNQSLAPDETEEIKITLFMNVKYTYSAMLTAVMNDFG